MKRILLPLIVLPLVFFIAVLVLFLHALYMGIFAPPVEGRAANYEQLARFPRIDRRLGYFPRAATNISFSFGEWGRGNILGEFDVPEAEFLEWADSMHWKLKQIPPSQPKYGPRVPVKRGYLFAARDFELGYDTEEERAYFVDLGFHRGPPHGEKADPR